MKLNDIHEADLLHMPINEGHYYMFNEVDVATRYKVSCPLKDRTAKTVSIAYKNMYKYSIYLNYPKQLHIDKGKEFYNDTATLFNKHGSKIVTSHELTHIVERYNCTIAEKLFSYQYH